MEPSIQLLHAEAGKHPLTPASSFSSRQLWDFVAQAYGTPLLDDDIPDEPYAGPGWVIGTPIEILAVLIWHDSTAIADGERIMTRCTLATAKTARRQGLATRLLETLIGAEFAAAEREIILEFGPSSGEAEHAFMQGQGFRRSTGRLHYRCSSVPPVARDPRWEVFEYRGGDPSLEQGLSRVHHRAFRRLRGSTTLPMDRFGKLAVLPRGGVLCARDQGELVAYGATNQHGTEGWVYYIAVDPKYWGTSVADTLGVALIEMLLSRGTATIDAMADEHNAPSRALLTRMGMKVMSQTDVYARMLVAGTACDAAATAQAFS
jgi:ribosomal protein S18 acetylase RimI-like enzyme